MIHYHVIISVRREIFSNYLEWLMTEHIAEVLKSPGFLKAELLYEKTGAAVESSSLEVQVQYTVESEALLKSYLSHRALELRQKGLDRFPGQFSAHRVVWNQVREFKRT